MHRRPEHDGYKYEPTRGATLFEVVVIVVAVLGLLLLVDLIV